MKLFSALFTMFKQSPALLAVTVVSAVIVAGSTWGVITLASQNSATTDTVPAVESEPIASTPAEQTTAQPKKQDSKKKATTTDKTSTSAATTGSTSSSAGSSSGGSSGGGGTSSGGGSSASCTSPVFSTSSTDGGWSNGGYYVHNNMWNVGGYSVSETLKACSYKNWYVTATANNNSHDGAVKTYPNVHKDYHDWGSGNEPRISSFSKITSSFAATSPHVGIYNVAYDIWINGVADSGSTELMVWTENYNQVPGGSKVTSVTLGGKTYDVYKWGSDYIAFVPKTTMTSGSLDLLQIFNWVIGKGWMPANSTLGQICYGVEIVSTGGSPARFDFTNFSISD